MGDHLHLHGGGNGLLLDGVDERGGALEDVDELRCPGDPGRGRPLLLHARVLDPAPWLPDPLSLHRLDDHRPPADDRVLPDPLCGAASLSAGVFYRLLFGTVFMLAAGYCGESHFIDPVLGFVVGLCGWFFILSEIFIGEAGKCAAQLAGASQYVQESFKTMRYIVTVGWCIYPLGYLFGYLLGSVDSASLNLLYNLADLV